MVNPCQYSLPFSVYSLSLSLVMEAAFWDPTVIPEDWHMYLRCFYATNCLLSVEPIYLPVGCECITTGDGSWADTVACYKQSQVLSHLSLLELLKSNVKIVSCINVYQI
jgi:hypothetical protein